MGASVGSSNAGNLVYGDIGARVMTDMTKMQVLEELKNAAECEGCELYRKISYPYEPVVAWKYEPDNIVPYWVEERTTSRRGSSARYMNTDSKAVKLSQYFVLDMNTELKAYWPNNFPNVFKAIRKDCLKAVHKRKDGTEVYAWKIDANTVIPDWAITDCVFFDVEGSRGKRLRIPYKDAYASMNVAQGDILTKTVKGGYYRAYTHDEFRDMFTYVSASDAVEKTEGQETSTAVQVLEKLLRQNMRNVEIAETQIEQLSQEKFYIERCILAVKKAEKSDD